jgi:hypothetical protein
MADKRKVYPIQLGELVWAGRKPGELSREFGPSDLHQRAKFLDGASQWCS